MRGRISGGLGVLGAIGLMLALAVPAGAARATGKESFRGIIAASGETGSRVVVGSLIAAKGVFTGSGRIVEVPNRPSDPDNVSRDDLVFSEGKMHLVSTNKSFAVSVNPKTCAARVRIRQTARVTGGTGSFATPQVALLAGCGAAEWPLATATEPAHRSARCCSTRTRIGPWTRTTPSSQMWSARHRSPYAHS